MPAKTDYPFWGHYLKISASDGESITSWENDAGQGIDATFKVTKTGDSTPNELELTIYNLNKDSREFLSRRNVNIELYAGYKESNGLIFKGNIELANSTHQGADWETKIYCKDGGAALRNITISKTFKKGTDIKDVIGSVLKEITKVPPGLKAQFEELSKIAQGKIDLESFKPKKQPVKKAKLTAEQKKIPSVEVQKKAYLDKKQNQRESAASRQTKKAITLRGLAVDKLNLLCKAYGLTVHVTDQSINIYPEGAALDADVTIIVDGTSGLIGSPEKTEDGVKVQSLLRHEFNAGMIIDVASIYFDGFYLIQRIEHNGDTKGTSGAWVSDVFCTQYL